MLLDSCCQGTVDRCDRVLVLLCIIIVRCVAYFLFWFFSSCVKTCLGTIE
ncbi:hypothetical protein Hanom_Chr03g00195751 [Helianthus anomalus]